MPVESRAESWLYSDIHGCACKVIEEQLFWGRRVFRIWVPSQNKTAMIPVSASRPLSEVLPSGLEPHRIGYVAAAAKVAEVLEGHAISDDNVLLAPMESNVIPLPHQIRALSRAISGDRIRYLLADEVGLGKTIEAGLVMRELKIRGLVRRTLVVTPKGLATQWATEMRTHFREDFRPVLGDDIAALQRLAIGSGYRQSPWSVFDQVIVSLDSVKPMDKRRGWSAERIAEYNRARFEDLVTAGWDLVIVDEAHRLGGSSDQVARHKLGAALAEAAPYVLLLSATPHQGKSDAFYRLMNLLDTKAFPDMESVSRDRVSPFVIRTEKRKAIDAMGQPLFKPRRTETAGVKWEARHHLQQGLYEAVTGYVREGYNQALREKKRHIGFLMVLMQRLVVSSTRAIRTTLERRLEALELGEQKADLQLQELENGAADLDELYDLDGQGLLELLESRVVALKNESSRVVDLLEAARKCEQAGPDAKAEALIQCIYQLQSDENDPDLKILVFTEFVPTQQMLKEFLEARGIAVVTLNGSMDIEERKRAQDAFRDKARVLVSTDAGGEGLNLQFCQVVINYDIPWNPMRLEQRIGRVDRIGQTKAVRAINFVFEDSVEFRVREVLEEKLAVILNEFGIDKTSDVLDSAQAGELFEEAFASAIGDPDGLEATIDRSMARIREEVRVVRERSAIYDMSEEPDQHATERLRSHPLPHWVERMTVSFLNSHGGNATRKRSCWELIWPDGEIDRRCVFDPRDAERLSDVTMLNLEDERIRRLALSLPQFFPGQPVPCAVINGLPANLEGLWGLFEIRLEAGTLREFRHIRIPTVRRGFVSIFVNKDNRVFLPTARHIWDCLQTVEPQVVGFLGHEDSQKAYATLTTVAEEVGYELLTTLQNDHASSITREKERGATAFKVRKKAIERVGLPEVRKYRMARCVAEEADWRKELGIVEETLPELRPLLMMRIAEGGHHE